MNSIILALSLFVTAPERPAHIDYLTDHPYQSYGIFAASNIATGCLIGGLGSLYNGGEFGKACLKGMWGNFLVFQAKAMIGLVGDRPGIGALARVVANTGASITQSAVENRRFDSIYFDFGPLGVSVGKETRFSFTLTPLVAIVGYAFSGHRLDLKQSIYNLTPVFAADRLKDDNAGGNSANVVIYDRRYGKEDITAILQHEMVHTIQWTTFQPFNTFHYGRYNLGQDVSYLVTTVPEMLNSLYYYHPAELEAYGLVGR